MKTKKKIGQRQGLRFGSFANGVHIQCTCRVFVPQSDTNGRKKHTHTPTEQNKGSKKNVPIFCHSFHYYHSTFPWGAKWR